MVFYHGRFSRGGHLKNLNSQTWCFRHRLYVRFRYVFNALIKSFDSGEALDERTSGQENIGIRL